MSHQDVPTSLCRRLVLALLCCRSEFFGSQSVTLPEDESSERRTRSARNRISSLGAAAVRQGSAMDGTRPRAVRADACPGR